MPAVITEKILNSLSPSKQPDNWAPKALMGAGLGLGVGGLAYGASKLSDAFADQMVEHRLNKLVKDTEERKQLVHENIAGDIGRTPEQEAMGEAIIGKNTKSLDRSLFRDSNDILNHHSMALKNHALLRKILLMALPVVGGLAGYAYSKTGSDKMNDKTAFLTGFAKFAHEKGLTSEEADIFLKVASQAVDRAASDASMVMRGGMGALGGGIGGALIARIIGKMRGQNEFKTQVKDVPIGAGIGSLAGAGLGALSAKLGSVKTAGVLGAAGKMLGKAKSLAPTAAAPAQSALIPKLRKAIPTRPIPASAPHIPKPQTTFNLDAPGLQAEGGLAPQAAGAPQSPLIPKNIFPQMADDAATQTAKIRMPAPPNSSASPAIRQAPRPPVPAARPQGKGVFPWMRAASF